MHPRSMLSEAQRARCVELFEQGWSYARVADLLGVKRSWVKTLQLRWRLFGRACLGARRVPRRYSQDVKNAVVAAYWAGETYLAIAARFGLSSPSQVWTWVHGDTKRDTKGDPMTRNPNPKPAPGSVCNLEAVVEDTGEALPARPVIPDGLDDQAHAVVAEMAAYTDLVERRVQRLEAAVAYLKARKARTSQTGKKPC